MPETASPSPAPHPPAPDDEREPGSLVEVAPGLYRDPATGDQFLAPSSLASTSLDPRDAELFDMKLRLSSLERKSIEWGLAEKVAQPEADPVRPTSTLETYALTHGAAPAVDEMAQALEGWNGTRQ